ncbi:hypothetical protein [Chryseobacterium cheonjiense]|uniref:Uncharacterized protein n=1 Tax=Chryseobacterium cheonjiense TaxID=2728845 RepID=A0A7Y0A3D4_9FLAO|nr:hypothetical protein [Chryseobacterium cheonjiense]NML55820.1 hypothetical protein [Chryseobacterium cheonjiense]
MENFKIGNWLITDKGISWNKENELEYLIAKEDLAESGPQDRSNIYDWLVHMPTKSWINKEDVYALNTAFIYAMELYGFDFNTNSFIETIKEQQVEMRLK